MTEQRFTPKGRLEVRKDGDEPATISGYGAVFYREGDPGTEYELWEGAVERIMPGAFDRALQEDDVKSLFNHDPNIVLGRTSSGTLKLSVDETGLRYEVTPNDTQTVNDLVIAPINRGDIDGSSFMFNVAEDGQEWSKEERDGQEISVRSLTGIAPLVETGPVTFPAYASTSADARTEARASFTKWDDERRALEEQQKLAAEAEQQKIRDDLDLKEKEAQLLAMN